MIEPTTRNERRLVVLAAPTASPGCANCCEPAPSPSSTDSSPTTAARHRVLWLSLFSLGWMTAEGIIGLIAGTTHGSVALVGWALGSVIEGLASVIVIWRFTGTRTVSETAESRAQRAVAVTFFLLAPYIAVEAARDLANGNTPSLSITGIVVTALSLILMPVLGVAKRRLGTRLTSGATAAEGNQNMLCAAQAGAVLIGLIATATFGWTWADPVIAFLLAAWAIREGFSTWRGNTCC